MRYGPVLALLWLGCAGRAPAVGEPEVPQGAGEKRPIEPGVFEPGPPIAPAMDLLAWLDGNEAVVQLPVRIENGVVGIASSVVAFPGAEPDLALAIVTDDSALGISLHDRVRQHCADAPTCHLWLEGRWHGTHWFQVLRVVGPVLPTDEPRARVEVKP